MQLSPNTGGGGGVFGYNIDGLCPQGQAIAICLDIRDQFGVDRKKYQSEEIEKQDVTRFLFGFIGQDGKPYLVQTYEMKISGNSGSNLVEFLKAWTNHDPYDFDYLTLKGAGAMLSVGVKQSTRTPGKWYNIITAVSPVYHQLQAQIPQAHHFAQLLQKALTPPDPAASRPTNQPAMAQQSFAPQPPLQQQPSGVTGIAASRKFWVQVPGAAAPVADMTTEQVLAGLARYPQGLTICPMDAPQMGWQPPQAFGIVASPPPPQMPPMPPPPSAQPAWNQPPQGNPPPHGVVQGGQNWNLPPQGTTTPPPPQRMQQPPAWAPPASPMGAPPLQDDIPF